MKAANIGGVIVGLVLLWFFTSVVYNIGLETGATREQTFQLHNIDNAYQAGVRCVTNRVRIQYEEYGIAATTDTAAWLEEEC